MNWCLKTVLYFSRWICVSSHLVLVRVYSAGPCSDPPGFAIRDTLLTYCSWAGPGQLLQWVVCIFDIIKTNFKKPTLLLPDLPWSRLVQGQILKRVVLLGFVCNLSSGLYCELGGVEKKSCIFFQFLEKCVYERGNYLLFSFSCCRLFLASNLLFWEQGSRLNKNIYSLKWVLLCF